MKSAHIPAGKPAPPFNLPSVEGRRYSLDSFKDKKILVVMFLCNHCPYVKAMEDRIIDLAKYYGQQGVQFVGICSNDPKEHPENSPQNLLKRWKEKGYGFPYLIDETQQVAKDFGAVITPDYFMFDAQRKLVYHGGMENAGDQNEYNPKLRSMVRDYLSMRVRIRAEAVSGHRVADTGVMHHGMRA